MYFVILYRTGIAANHRSPFGCTNRSFTDVETCIDYETTKKNIDINVQNMLNQIKSNQIY